MESVDGPRLDMATSESTSAGDWVEEWNAEGGGGNNSNSMGKMIRVLQRQERTDMRNRFLSIDMDAKVGATAAAGVWKL